LSSDTSPGNASWKVSSSIAGVTSRCITVTSTGAAHATTC
jgi:hypothetical protein